MRSPPEVLVISRRDIERVMTPSDWLDTAERAFHAAADQEASSPQPMHIPVSKGGFHMKAAAILGERDYVAVKVNGNFPRNPEENGLPTVQGAIILSDGRDGALLAIIDSVEVTLRRTAAASALAARLLARSDSSTLLVCGCGAQARSHVSAIQKVLPLKRLLFWDRVKEAADALASELGGRVVSDLEAAAPCADVIACCTSATDPYLRAHMVKPGTFIAAVGADNPHKSEIDPHLMASSVVVADSLRQCTNMGDLHHAIAAQVMTKAQVRAELADVLSGAAEGRRSADEIIIFDSTGTGVLDVAASAVIYERCVASGAGQHTNLAC